MTELQMKRKKIEGMKLINFLILIFLLYLFYTLNPQSFGW